MNTIENIRKQVTEYCVRNQNLVIGFSLLSNEEREHIYDIAASVVMTRDQILKGGSFVCAIVENNLSSAVSRADEICRRALALFVTVNEWFKIQ